MSEFRDENLAAEAADLEKLNQYLKNPRHPRDPRLNFKLNFAFP
jgi:hypothetical protein